MSPYRVARRPYDPPALTHEIGYWERDSSQHRSDELSRSELLGFYRFDPRLSPKSDLYVAKQWNREEMVRKIR